MYVLGARGVFLGLMSARSTKAERTEEVVRSGAGQAALRVPSTDKEAST